ncbi:MAG: radical SAM protein [Spirochaetota bacterium]|jgi:hypothetical protein|nr:radical SAM protein [Spirochaetota bacterium]
MSKDILLFVNPYIEDFAAYDHFMKPYGLLLLAAQFRESYDLYFLDAQARKDCGSEYCGSLVSEKIATPAILAEVPRRYRRYGIAASDFIAKAKALPVPRFIFVTSGMTYWYGGVQYTIALLRGIFPEAKILLGGNYACLLEEYARKYSGADYVIAKKDLASVVREVRTIISDAIPEAPILTHIPAWDLLDSPGAHASLPVLTSFGCPYRCSYCSGWKLEPRSALDLAQALELFTHARTRYGTRCFAFYDDALLVGSETHALPLFTELARICPDLELFTPNGLHARHITRELARAMRACGFRDARLALESIDDAYIQSSGAKITRDEFARAADHLFEAGFAPGEIKAYCMVGAPRPQLPVAGAYAPILVAGAPRPQQDSEDIFVHAESVHETMEFARRLSVVPMLAWYSPVPGSRDFAFLAERYDLSDPLRHNNTAWIYQVWPGERAYQELKSHEREARDSVHKLNECTQETDQDRPAR